ncbi:MAG: tRNA pseudouridine(55) synthase TruB [Limnobacter sp.]|nr:tRNA pseudouridine(55) synthase TruB [Limnobacter sp.]
MSGVLLLDKAKGDSSNQALQTVRRLFQAKKTGHTGTLDPLASGLLPLMFGEATKFAADLIDADKEYEATIRLGVQSSTGDAEGQLHTCDLPVQSLVQSRLEEAAEQFTGEIEQLPPMYSALKKDGKPLYEYARQGLEVERKPRLVVIKAFDLLEVNHQPEEPSVRIRVLCSKGTYIRTLAEDFALALGTGGYLTDLRRVAVGRLSLADALSVKDIQARLESGCKPESLLAPVDSLLNSLQSVQLDAKQTERFLHGQRLPLDLAGMHAARSRIYGFNNQKEPAFLGTGILETDGKTALLRPERLIQETL